MSAKRPTTVQGWHVHIATVQADIRQTENAAPNRAETVAGIEAHCRADAAMGDQTLARHVATGDIARALTLRAGPDGTANAAQLMGTLLGSDVVVAAMIRHLPDGPGGLPTAERAVRLAALAAERFNAECAEEALHEAAEARGEVAHRRPDADPATVIGTWEATVPAAVFDPAEPITSEPRARVGRSAYLARGRTE